MSVESAKEFLGKLKEDKGLQERVEGADTEEKFLDVVKESGFDFTKDEWLKVLEEGGELTEGDLKDTAGGTGVSLRPGGCGAGRTAGYCGTAGNCPGGGGGSPAVSPVRDP